MTTTAVLLPSTVTVQAVPARTQVWPVLLVTTIVLAAVLACTRRWASTERAFTQLMGGILVLGTSAFGVVFPVLTSARDQLDAIARAGGEGFLAFIVTTSTVGVAACLLMGAQVLRVLVSPLVRFLTRRPHTGVAVEAPVPTAARSGRQP